MNPLMTSINSKYELCNSYSQEWIATYGTGSRELWQWINKKHMLARIGIDLHERDRKEIDKQDIKVSNQLTLF